MDFDIPADLAEYLVELDEFIEREIKPLEQENDNIRFSARPAGAPTPRATTATRSRRSTAARRARISGWP
jgi:hypothetical protein